MFFPGKTGGDNMKYISLIGAVASAANVVIHYNNDAAFWGWLASTMWSGALFLHELVQDK